MYQPFLWEGDKGTLLRWKIWVWSILWYRPQRASQTQSTVQKVCIQWSRVSRVSLSWP